MPALQVRDLPDNIYKELSLLAKAEHRSLAQEAIVVLQRGLGIRDHGVNIRQAILKKVLSQKAVLPKNMNVLKGLREDRAR